MAAKIEGRITEKDREYLKWAAAQVRANNARRDRLAGLRTQFDPEAWEAMQRTAWKAFDRLVVENRRGQETSDSIMEDLVLAALENGGGS